MSTSDLERELHHPLRRKILSALAREPDLNKSKLAEAVYGRADTSTRSMITRLTALLVELGVLEDRLAGRERLVRLSARGHAIVTSWQNSPVTAASSDLEQVLQPQDSHATDRPRLHLRHAALLAMAGLLRTQRTRPGHEHFRQILLQLIDESANSTPEDDAKAFLGIARSWPAEDHTRMLLAETLVRFQIEGDRRDTLNDLLVLGDLLEPGPDAILWATAAIAVAHLHVLEPSSTIEKIAARRLIQTAIPLLEKSVTTDSSLAIAVEYRLAKASKVLLGGWNWRAQSDVPLTIAATEGDQPALANAINRANTEVSEAGRLNKDLRSFEQLVIDRIGARVVEVRPAAEPMFRHVSRPGAARETCEWIVEHIDLMTDVVNRLPMDNEFRSTLEAASTCISSIDASDANVRALAPYRLQINHLLSSSSQLQDAPKFDIPVLTNLMRNNLWPPAFVVVQAVAQRALS